MQRTRMGGAPATGIALLALAGMAFPVAAQDASLHQGKNFYQGKTVVIAAGAATGGGLDTYARLIARHLGKHIPGNPNVVVANMPGAGGQVAARHLYAVAPKDGTHMATFFPSVLIDPLLGSGPRQIDPNRFQFIGNARAEVSVCVVRKDAPLATLADLRKTEIVIGATTPGSQVVDYPLVESRLLDLKIKLTTGYKGTREIAAAIEKGEVQGICGIGWTSIKVQYPDIGTPGSLFRVLMQEDAKGDPELNAAGIPGVMTLARTPEERDVLDLLYAQNLLARPYVAPPDTPPERVEILRAAFMRAAADADLQGEARKMRIEVSGTSGADMQKIVETMYAAPRPVVENLARMLKRQ